MDDCTSTYSVANVICDSYHSFKDRLADTAFVLCIHVFSEIVNSSMKKRVSGVCLLFITAYGHLSLWNTINGVICFCCRKFDAHLNETDSACVV